MSLSCIVIDDEPLAVKLLESFIAKTPDLVLLASFTDSVEAITAVKQQQPDLLFLDIQMPDLNGMELAHMLPPATRVIFTTAFKEYAFESYEVRALDFLLKPIRYNKFLAAVEKAREWFARDISRSVESVSRREEGGVWSENTPATESASEHTSLHTPHSTLLGTFSSLHDTPSPSPTVNSKPSTVNNNTTLFLKVDGEYRQISLSDILYVSGMKDYVMFFLDSEHRPLVTHLTMKAVEEMLPADRFMRVHRSFIVCLDKIRKVDRNDCIYIGEAIIHVTDAYLPAFHDFLASKFPGSPP